MKRFKHFELYFTFYECKKDMQVNSTNIQSPFVNSNCKLYKATRCVIAYSITSLSYGRVFCLESQKIDGTEYLR